MKKIISIIMILSMTLALFVPVYAAEPIVISPCDDTHTIYSSSNKNKTYATAEILTVRNGTQNVFFKFPIDDTVGLITSVNLTVFLSSHNSGSGNLFVYGLDSSYNTLVDEDTLTGASAYNNDFLKYNASSVGLLKTIDYNTRADLIENNGGQLDIDVTSFVKEHLSDGYVSFMLYNDASTKKINFYSKENPDTTKHPELVITVDTSNVGTDMASLKLNDVYAADFNLPTEGENGSAISWATSDENIIAINKNFAVVTRDLIQNKTVKLTATISDSETSMTKEFDVKVPAYMGEINAVADVRVRNDGTGNVNNPDTYCQISTVGTHGHGFMLFDNTFNSEYNHELIQSVPYITLNFAAARIAPGTLRVYGISGDTEYKKLISEDAENGLTYSKAIEEGLYDYKENILAEIPIESIPASEYISIDVTDYVKSQTDGVYAYRFEADIYNGQTPYDYTRIYQRTSDYPAFMIGYMQGDKAEVESYLSSIEWTEPRLLTELILPEVSLDDTTFSWSASEGLTINDNVVSMDRSETDYRAYLSLKATKNGVDYVRNFPVIIPKLAPNNGIYFLNENTTVCPSINNIIGENLTAHAKIAELNEECILFVAVYDKNGKELNSVVIDDTPDIADGIFDFVAPVVIPDDIDSPRVSAMLMKKGTFEPMFVKTTIR